MLAEYDHPAFGQVRSVGLPMTMGGFERTYRHGPALNGDQAAILAELAYDEPAIEALRADGAFGVVDGDDLDGRAASEPG